jgi:hypothetical protein
LLLRARKRQQPCVSPAGRWSERSAVAPTGFGLVPLGGLDPALHIGLAAGLGYFGFMHREAGVHV